MWVCVNRLIFVLECFKRRHSRQKLKAMQFLGVPVLRCDEYGNYDTIQCHKSVCLCADLNIGVRIRYTFSSKIEELSC